MRAQQTSAASHEDFAIGEGAARMIEDALAETVALLGYDIILVEWATSGRTRVLRLFLDHPEGVALDDCARMGRVIGDALDAAEADPEQPALSRLLSQPYNLEVSSPGIERPLVKRSHYARFIGRRAVVKTDRPQGDNNQKTFHGIIVAADEDPATPGDDRQGIVALRDPDSGAEYRLPIAVIRRANLVFEG